MTDQPIAATHPAQGGVTAARGFRASGVHAGFRKDPERLDLALVVADEPCACAAVFTKNVFCSAPVIVSRAQLGADQPGEPAYGTARAVVVNSGNANAATGEPGLEAARETARIAGDAVGCPASEVLVASTGVIGVQLPLAPFGIGLPAAASLLSAGGGADAARAIMTTDTRPKEAAVTFSGDGIGYDGCTFTVGGMSGARARRESQLQQGDGGFRHVDERFLLPLRQRRRSTCGRKRVRSGRPGLRPLPGGARRGVRDAGPHDGG